MFHCLTIIFGVPCHHMTCVQGPGQYSVYGMGHRICFQPPGVGFHHCKQMVFALVGFWDSDRVNMPGHLIFRLQPLSSIPNCLAGLIASCVTFTNKLSGSVCGQDHPGTTRPSLCGITSLMVSWAHQAKNHSPLWCQTRPT